MTNYEDVPVLNRDLTSQSFPTDLDWGEKQRIKSLESVYDFVIAECDQAIRWYYYSKNNKKNIGYFSRLLAILAVAIASVIPILGEIYETDNRSDLSPAWATIALAAAALLVALDRLGGHTSGWVRYIRTAQKLTMLQGDFRLNWEKDRIDRESSADPERIKKSIELCQQFLKTVNTEVQAETNVWAQEFQQVLLDLENPNLSQNGT